jgi:hypothetical protein
MLMCIRRWWRAICSSSSVSGYALIAAQGTPAARHMHNEQDNWTNAASKSEMAGTQMINTGTKAALRTQKTAIQKDSGVSDRLFC